MSLYLDIKYINSISHRLERFKWSKDSLAACRCPICGDSHTSKTKTRFYFYEDDADRCFKVKCHNCGYANSFFYFLRDFDESSFREYQLDKIKDKIGYSPATPDDFASQFEPVHFMPRLDLPTISSLPDDHRAKDYLLRRKIPEKFLSDLYFAEDFSVIAQDFREGMYIREPRIVIPLRTKSGDIFGIQGRSLAAKTKLRYLTLKAPGMRHLPKVYGLDKVHDYERIYCTEGAFDSMFLPNAIAMNGSSVRDLSQILNVQDLVFVFDNEPRNYELLQQMEGTIKAGQKICIWPRTIYSKDINEMILNGEVPQEKMAELIDANTFQNLEANIMLSQWRIV